MMVTLYCDSTPTQEDADNESSSDEEVQEMPQKGYNKFHLYLINAVFCDHCQCEHRPFQPSL